MCQECVVLKNKSLGAYAPRLCFGLVLSHLKAVVASNATKVGDSTVVSVRCK